jgi:8-oxo-dGTP pyrophosphatase MutT (NUDIX family)
VTDRFVVVPAAYVLLLRPSSRPGHAGEREVLLLLREGTGFMDGHWASVAGHVEKGESVYDAAAREAAEEVDVHDLALTPLCSIHRTGAGAPVDERVDWFFTATTWSGEPRVVEPQKSGGIGWFPLTALPTPVVPHELTVLQHLRAGAVPPIQTHGF